jgi:hypothetical protein
MPPKTYIYIMISLLAISLVLAGCGLGPEKTSADDFPVLTGNYLGQPRPGTEAELFARGIISDPMHNRDVTISFEGDEMYFGLANAGIVTIIWTKRVDGRWTKPDIAPFATDPDIFDFEPCISPDGETFMFLSTRAPEGKEPRRGWAYQNIWAMDKTADGWSKPYDLGKPINSDGAEYFPSLTNDGTLYFTRSGGTVRESYIYRARLTEGGYDKPEKLGPGVNSGTMQYNAFVAPDESYLIYLVPDKEGNIGLSDYHISFRNEDDTWTGPINMGPKVNRPGATGASPYVTRDGKYFFFSSTKPLPEGMDLSLDLIKRLYYEPENGSPDIYWIEASFIEELRPE